MDTEDALSGLASELAPLERLLGLFSASLDQPKLADVEGGRAYRYETPDVRYFCLLKGVLAINTLYAVLELARGGYIFQVNALLRLVYECTTHIEFVLDPSQDAKHKEKVAEYIASYFADFDRDPSTPFEKAPIKQGQVNATIGKTLDDIAAQYESEEGRKPAAQAYFSVFRALSNFIHGRYPETVDLYGGRPGRFHLHGMSGTRKDMEMVVTLEPIIGTVSNVFAHMVQALELRKLVEGDPVIAAWYKSRVGLPRRVSASAAEVLPKTASPPGHHRGY